MWPQTFSDRLAAWSALRQSCTTMDRAQALDQIDSWWQQTPWRAYHLHWDDQADWPDPWQLLDDNIYCPLARALGIMYTIAMLDRSDMQDVVLAEVGGDNLVLVDKEKYILNWDGCNQVNINPGTKLRRSISLQELQKQIQ
jgi:hypothetical protein